MSYSVAEYVLGWLFYGLQYDEKNGGFISNRFRVVHQREIRDERQHTYASTHARTHARTHAHTHTYIYTHTHTHTHTLTYGRADAITIGENAFRLQIMKYCVDMFKNLC